MSDVVVFTPHPSDENFWDSGFPREFFEAVKKCPDVVCVNDDFGGPTVEGKVIMMLPWGAEFIDPGWDTVTVVVRDNKSGEVSNWPPYHVSLKEEGRLALKIRYLTHPSNPNYWFEERGKKLRERIESYYGVVACADRDSVGKIVEGHIVMVAPWGSPGTDPDWWEFTITVEDHESKEWSNWPPCDVTMLGATDHEVTLDLDAGHCPVCGTVSKDGGTCGHPTCVAAYESS